MRFFLFATILCCQFTWAQELTDKEHEQWLKDKFSEQHQALIPKVAVADIFTGCNRVRKTDPVPYKIKDLVQKMPKNLLAEKLTTCLAEDSLQSEIALDFGLKACFKTQFAELSQEEQTAKLAKVDQLLQQLPKEEKQKSFTSCVTTQAISYLK